MLEALSWPPGCPSMQRTSEAQSHIASIAHTSLALSPTFPLPHPPQYNQVGASAPASLHLCPATAAFPGHMPSCCSCLDLGPPVMTAEGGRKFRFFFPCAKLVLGVAGGSSELCGARAGADRHGRGPGQCHGPQSAGAPPAIWRYCCQVSHWHLHCPCTCCYEYQHADCGQLD